MCAFLKNWMSENRHPIEYHDTNPRPTLIPIETYVLWASDTARTVGFWTSAAEVWQPLAGRIAVPAQENFKPWSPEGEPAQLSQTSDLVEVVTWPSAIFHMFCSAPLVEHVVPVRFCKSCTSGQGHSLHSSVAWFSLTRTATFLRYLLLATTCEREKYDNTTTLLQYYNITILL